MITEVPTDKIDFIATKIQQIVILSQEVAQYDTGFIYLLDMADRLLQGCRERIKSDSNKIDESAR